jgi:hypothetical protein
VAVKAVSDKIERMASRAVIRSQNQEAEMGETVAPANVANAAQKKHRSPAYPFISLEKAINRARELYRHDNRHASPVAAAIKHWGFAEKSSGGQQTIAALKQYGLLADDGSGADRRVKLTDRALSILLDEVENSPEKSKAIRDAALAPKLFAEMFNKWGAELPSPETMRTFLRRDKGFNDEVLGVVIRAFKDSVSFAKLGQSDKVADDDLDNVDRLDVAIGDYIQWESQGMLQFVAPKRVTGISDDSEYVFVEGETTGVPMSQVSKAEPPAQHIHGAHIPPGTQLFPPSISHATAAGRGGQVAISVAREVSSLPEGEAMLQWPASISSESVKDLEDWLGLVIRKLKRRYAEASAGNMRDDSKS